MTTKDNMISLRVSDQMMGWLDLQGKTLGMSRSEVVRFWLQTSMLTFERSSAVVSEAVNKQLQEQMN